MNPNLQNPQILNPSETSVDQRGNVLAWGSLMNRWLALALYQHQIACDLPGACEEGEILTGTQAFGYTRPDSALWVTLEVQEEQELSLEP